MRYLILAATVLMIAACFGKQPEQHATGKEGTTVPAFTLQLPDSTSFFNSNNIERGKPFAVFYFSPHCPYCRAQTTEIIEDMDRLKDISFVFVTAFPYPFLKKYYNEYHLGNYPNITAGVDTAQLIGNYFEVPGVPFMAVYNKDRKLSKAFLGKVYTSQIIKAAEQ